MSIQAKNNDIRVFKKEKDICFSIKSAPRGTKLFSCPLLENNIFTELYY